MPATDHAPTEGQSKEWTFRKSLRALAAGSVGNFVEWYDFTIYGAQVAVISTLFFPQTDPALAVIGAFALYGVAFLARPLGGLFWGHMGDKYGRRNTLAAIILLMGAATTLVGFLPTYESIGITAAVLLALLRLLQGFSGGGEFTGSTSFITEYAPANRRGMYAAISATMTTFPSICATLTVLAIRASMSPEAYQEWGWRLGFWIAGPLALVGLIIRLKMDETPAFKELQEMEERSAETVEKAPLKVAFRSHWRAILLVFGVASLSALGAYTLSTYLIFYLEKVAGLPGTTALLASSVGFAVTVPLVPLVGLLGDRIGRRPLLVVGAVGFIVLSYPGYLLASTGTFATAVLGQLCLAAPWMFIVSALVIQMNELFPTSVRYSGASVGYNLGYTLFGGTAPIVGTWLISVTGSTVAPAFYLIGVATIVLLTAIRKMPETYRWDLVRDEDRVA